MKNVIALVIKYWCPDRKRRKIKLATYLVPLRTSYIHIHLNGRDKIQTDSMGNCNSKLPKGMAICCHLTLTHTCGLFQAPSNKGKHRHTETQTLQLLYSTYSESVGVKKAQGKIQLYFYTAHI